MRFVLSALFITSLKALLAVSAVASNDLPDRPERVLLMKNTLLMQDQPDWNWASEQEFNGSLPDSWHRKVLEYFSAQGYFDAAVDSVVLSEKKPSEILIYVSPGSRYVIGRLNRHIRDGAADDRPLFYGEGDPYDQQRLEETMHRMLSHTVSQGYLKARLEITGFDPDPVNARVDIDLEMIQGSLYRVKGIEIHGLKGHDADYVRIASGIRPENRITRELLDKGRRNLVNTGLFLNVSEGEPILRGDNAYVVYEVVEQEANHFDLMFGYVPGGSGNRDFAGRGELSVRHIGWHGSELGLLFERYSDGFSRLHTGFQRHWIRSLPLGMELEVGFLQQDTLYQIREWRLESRFDHSAGRRLAVYMKQEFTSSQSGPETEMLALNGVTHAAGFRYLLDQTDDPFNPMTGWAFELEVETGLRIVTDNRAEELGIRKRMNRNRAGFASRFYVRPFNRQVAAWRVHAETVELPVYTEADLSRLGGAGSVRGYREDQFRIARSAWSDVEYRYLLDPWSHAFVFAAGGLWQRPDMGAAAGSVGWLRSAGFGFRYLTPVGRLQFTYAVSDEDLLYNGKVHIAFSSRF